MDFATLDLGGTSYRVGTLEGRAALSELFRFEVRISSADALPAPADVLGKDAKLTLEDPHERSLVVHGIAAAVAWTPGGAAMKGGELEVTVEPAVAALAVGRDHRVFQDKNVVDVAKAVLQKAGVAGGAVRWSTTGSYPVRPYWAQYGESDWAFLERILAEHGIYYYFDLGADATTLVFADDSTAAPAIDGDASMPFREESGLRASRDSVARVAMAWRAVTDKVTLRDYNFDKPRLTLEGSSGDGPRETYDFPGRFAAPADGNALAKARAEAMRARRAVVTGDTGSTRLRPGLTFEIAEHPVEKLNQKLLVESVTIRAAGLRGAEGEALAISWAAIPVATAYRPPPRPAARPSGGPQTGVVVGASGEEIHPDNKGRIRVQHHWDREGKRDDKAATWIRVGQFPLGGSMIIPRIGWDVLVHHHEGDVEQPVAITHLYDGEHPVPYALPANKTRTAWQTATTPGGGSTNEVRFEDKAGSEEMFFNASKDMNVVVGNDKNETVGVDSEETIGSNMSLTVGANYKHDVASSQSVTVGASESLTVSGNRNVNVGGSETSTIGGSRSVTVTKGSSIDATGGRTATIGGTMLAASGLGVSRMVMGSLSVTVGGAWISAAATGLSNMTAGAASETVGGAKIAAGAAGCATSVQGAAAVTVGGAFVIAAGGKGGETATGSMAITVGGALLASAPSVEIEADSEISVMVGGSSLTVKSGSVEVKAPLLLSPGATITKKGGTIEHN
jgi:type VI secretion system secreted protein VgrG